MKEIPFETPKDEYSLLWKSVDERCYADFTSQFGKMPGRSPIDRIQVGCLVGTRTEAVATARKWVGRIDRSTAEKIAVDGGANGDWQKVYKVSEGEEDRALEVRLLQQGTAWATVIVLFDRYPPTYVY